MQKKNKNKIENIQNEGDKRRQKNTSVYVIDDKKYKIKPGQMGNCKRKSVLDKQKDKENKEIKENKEVNDNKENKENKENIEIK